jgi:outer membrane lipoprotein-sorting protein
MKMWSKGTENTLVKILKPKKDKGITTLKKGDEIYNYFPKINKVMKVPSSMMMGSWMGSDFTNDDLVKESTYTKDYDFKLVTPDKESEYKLELKPKKTSVSVWGKIIIIIDKKTELPISQEYYDEHNEKIRVMNFKDVKLIGERLLPTTMELIPLSKSKKGNKTSFSYKKIVFDIDLDGNFFGLQNLRNK